MALVDHGHRQVFLSGPKYEHTVKIGAAIHAPAPGGCPRAVLPLRSIGREQYSTKPSMTSEPPIDGEVTSEIEFRELLAWGIRTAYRNGVSVEGGWECRNGEDLPDWETVILEVTKRDGDTGDGGG